MKYFWIETLLYTWVALGYLCVPARGAERPPAPCATTDFATSRSFEAPATEWPTTKWWQKYNDSQLSALIEEGIAHSPSMAVAQARLMHAAGTAQSEGAYRKPTVATNDSISEEKQSYNYLSPADVTPKGWKDYGDLELNFKWEIDFWGKNRAAFAAATSEWKASQADAAQASLILSSSIATAYAELARLYAERDTAVTSVEVRSKSVGLFQKRVTHGLETQEGLRRMESRRATAEADLEKIDERIAIQKNVLAALLGAGPDRGLMIDRPKARIDVEYALPENLAVDLIGRRPEIVATKLRVEADAQRVKMRKAEFYPNVNLTAFLGLQSLGLNMLTNPGSFAGSAGPALSLPIFNRGDLKGKLRGAQADYAEAVANYDESVAQALEEVANAGTSLKAYKSQLAKRHEAVDAARSAWQIANHRYDGGLDNYLDVLTSEDEMLAAQRTLTDLQARGLQLDIDLSRALGGGYKNEALQNRSSK